MFLTSLHELLSHHPSHALHSPQGFIQHLAGVLREGLKAQIHFRLRGVGNAVPYKFDIRVTREDCAQEIPEGMVFIVEDIGGASTIVLLLLDYQSFLGGLLLSHSFSAGGFGSYFLLLRHIVLRVRHYYL